jgi:hypothetical protein
LDAKEGTPTSSKRGHPTTLEDPSTGSVACFWVKIRAPSEITTMLAFRAEMPMLMTWGPDTSPSNQNLSPRCQTLSRRLINLGSLPEPSNQNLSPKTNIWVTKASSRALRFDLSCAEGRSPDDSASERVWHLGERFCLLGVSSAFLLSFWALGRSGTASRRARFTCRPGTRLA